MIEVGTYEVEEAENFDEECSNLIRKSEAWPRSNFVTTGFNPLTKKKR